MSHPYKVVAILLDNMFEITKKSQNKYEWDKLVTLVERLSKCIVVGKAREKDVNISLQETTQEKGQGY